jgi:peptide/nickel transport system permease protein
LNFKNSTSPGARAFRRFLKNKSAVAGLVIIISSIIIAVLGYVITPDSTPDANDQILQITNKAPGFKIQMLHVHKNKNFEDAGFFSKMFLGAENKFQLVPINAYRFVKDSVMVEEYTGSNDRFSEKKFLLADVLFPFSADNARYIFTSNEVSFNDYSGKKINASIVDLQKQVEKKNISRKTFLLGTDKLGRDMLSRLIIGVRISLSVGMIAVIISLLIGVTMGALAGYFRGILDDIIMWFINVIWSVPTLLLVFAMTLALGKGFWQIFIAVGLTMWVEAARIVRGQFLSLREMQYVEAAHSLGYSHFRTIMLHILPNTVGPLAVIAATNFASAIIVEAGLSFLGIGVQPPKPSWGGMLNENYGYIIGENPFLAIIPGIAIMLMVLAFNFVGNGLRDAMDVKTSIEKNN